MSTQYPVTFSVDYPKRELNRTTTFFRLIVAIPTLILLATVSGTMSAKSGSQETVVGAGGLLFFGPLLMIVFRQKYPKWWFTWNLEFMRFSARVGVFMTLLDDRYPSTDEAQSVHLDIHYPNVRKDLNRWLPLVKWLLAIPHYIVLVFLNIAVVLMVIIAWFNILFTGAYPPSIFDFVVNVMRWNIRVVSYAVLLVTDKYPPFSLG